MLLPPFVYLIVISYYTVRASAAVFAGAVLTQHAFQQSHLLPRAMGGSSDSKGRTVFTTFSLLAIFLIGITMGLFSAVLASYVLTVGRKSSPSAHPQTYWSYDSDPSPHPPALRSFLCVRFQRSHPRIRCRFELLARLPSSRLLLSSLLLPQQGRHTDLSRRARARCQSQTPQPS